MYVSHLSLHDFRSYPSVEVPLEAGVTAFVAVSYTHLTLPTKRIV